ncbi:uncharacterized protein G6M90_00g015490 [Metarhizium brunneum]|uniref:Uncharacterized protein n=1 Tax=Metarhizium brunneum TaxID=500148 RepID=A0A7D5YRV2_9HYPO|nr:hypothetical protein G6M90_00g015490 [Metarhizium brunneum]
MSALEMSAFTEATMVLTNSALLGRGDLDSVEMLDSDVGGDALEDRLADALDAAAAAENGDASLLSSLPSLFPVFVRGRIACFPDTNFMPRAYPGQSAPYLRQLPHSGRTSSHLTLLLRHSWHPVLRGTPTMSLCRGPAEPCTRVLQDLTDLWLMSSIPGQVSGWCGLMVVLNVKPDAV